MSCHVHTEHNLMSMFLSRVLILCLIWSAEIVKFLLLVFSCSAVFVTGIGADFRFEVPGQNSVGLIGGGRGQWLGGTMASAVQLRTHMKCNN